MRGVKNMNLKTLVLASLLCLSLPFAAKADNADNIEVQQNQNICTSLAECESSNINIGNTEAQTENNTISQRTRRSRISQYAQDYYIGVGGAIYFPDGGDVLFGGNVTGGIRFSPYVSGDADFLLGFGDFTLLGLLVGPKFEIGITETSDATAYISPGLGITYLDGDGASNTDFSFQIKTGVAFPAGENRVFGQGRYINVDGGDIFSIEGGVFL
jgi:hypothetical protein